MLGNKKKDFVHEMLLIVILDIFTGILLMSIPSFRHGNFGEDLFMAFIPPIIAYFGIIRIVRYAFVYHAYPVLYAAYTFFSITLIFIGVDAFHDFLNGLWMSGSVYAFLIVLIPTILYTLWIYQLKKRGLFKKTVPPERIQTLRVILTPKQKLTLVFPDRYIKYLKTGDKKYLEGRGNA